MKIVLIGAGSALFTIGLISYLIKTGLDAELRWSTLIQAHSKQLKS